MDVAQLTNFVSHSMEARAVAPSPKFVRRGAYALKMTIPILSVLAIISVALTVIPATQTTTKMPNALTRTDRTTLRYRPVMQH
ncbi:hypothetical protein H2248_002056 [Termitomyces sp. 'cryptogamus']|nr:hypothetical protein H2248_002056 [Termitomyces sp. 'cryptogamus']